jgi:hypothetical protein
MLDGVHDSLGYRYRYTGPLARSHRGVTHSPHHGPRVSLLSTVVPCRAASISSVSGMPAGHAFLWRPPRSFRAAAAAL